MGYIRHDAVIAIGWGSAAELAALAREIDALRAEMHTSIDGDESQVLVGPIAAPLNDYVSYVYLPDGSKEGFDSSDRHDEWRERFRAIVNRQRYWDVASINFGGDDYQVALTTVEVGGETVASTSTEPPR